MCIRDSISLAATLPKDRIRFVLCDCNLSGKLDLIRRNGLGEVPYLMCECGGQRSMGRLVEQFFESGVVCSA
jgi:hypothetical protein